MSESDALLFRLFDPVAFVREGVARQGELALAALERLSGQLAPLSPLKKLSWALYPERTADKRTATRFVIRGELPLICPVCLEEVRWPVAIDRRIVWYRSEAAIPHEEWETDDWDARLIGDETLLELLEEELLLELPMGALHSCAVPFCYEHGFSNERRT